MAREEPIDLAAARAARQPKLRRPRYRVVTGLVEVEEGVRLLEALFLQCRDMDALDDLVAANRVLRVSLPKGLSLRLQDSIIRAWDRINGAGPDDPGGEADWDRSELRWVREHEILREHIDEILPAALARAQADMAAMSPDEAAPFAHNLRCDLVALAERFIRMAAEVQSSQ